MSVFEVVEDANLIQHFLAPVLFHRLHCHVVDCLLLSALKTKTGYVLLSYFVHDGVFAAANLLVDVEVVH